MTARPQDVALLPLPTIDSHIGGVPLWGGNKMRVYALEVATAALASAQAREDELRAEVAENEGAIRVWRRRCTKAEARAERLEEALRAAMNEAEGCMFEAWLARTCPGGDVESVHRQWEASSEFEEFLNEWSEASAALSTNAATQPGETT